LLPLARVEHWHRSRRYFATTLGKDLTAVGLISVSAKSRVVN
jgi:hypothetical protein